MYQLSLHIEYLLLRHDCVVVPGLGAFINVRHSARFDAQSGVWHPMMREVRFNSALRHDDGLLTGSYARKHGVAFARGRDYLRAAISELRAALERDGEVTLGQLGIMRMEEGALSFMPMTDATLMTRLLGYWEAPTAKTASATGRTIANPTKVSVSEAGIEPDDETHVSVADAKDENGTVRRFNTSRNYYIPVNKVLAQTAACLLIAVVAVLSLITPFTGSRDNRNIDKASVLPLEQVVDRVGEAMAEDGDGSAEAREATSDVQTDETVSEAGPMYHAIVATFHSESQAEEFMSQHKDCGYDLTIVNGKKIMRVSAGSSADREALQREMMSADFRTEFPAGSWLWKQE